MLHYRAARRYRLLSIAKTHSLKVNNLHCKYKPIVFWPILCVCFIEIVRIDLVYRCNLPRGCVPTFQSNCTVGTRRHLAKLNVLIHAAGEVAWASADWQQMFILGFPIGSLRYYHNVYSKAIIRILWKDIIFAMMFTILSVVGLHVCSRVPVKPGWRNPRESR